MKNRGGSWADTGVTPGDFPTSPGIVGGKVMMPADLQRIHSSVLNGTMTGMISEETRAVVESLWPSCWTSCRRRWVDCVWRSLCPAG